MLFRIQHTPSPSYRRVLPLAKGESLKKLAKNLIYCLTLKQKKHHEKQGTLENGDSVRHIDSDGSTDCYEHHFVYGTWTDIYLKEGNDLEIDPSIS